jgi:hypothetical protein
MSAVRPLSGAKQTLSKPHSATAIYEYTPLDPKYPRLAEMRRRIRRHPRNGVERRHQGDRSWLTLRLAL